MATTTAFKMKLNIDDKSLADIPITKIIFDSKLHLMTIYSDRIFKISGESWLGKAQIIMVDRNELYVERYISQNPLNKGRHFPTLCGFG